MGLLDRIKDTFFSADGELARPRPATFDVLPNTVHAPVTGMVVSLEEVNDEVISGGLFGRGCGIMPVDGVVYAPVSGCVSVTAVTNHMIGMTMDVGVELLIHVGLGTVDMDGRGFERLVEEGQEVVAGTPLLVFDREEIAESGYDDVVTCVVTNYSDFDGVEGVYESGTLIGGRPLVKVGDPLLVVRHAAR